MLIFSKSGSQPVYGTSWGLDPALKWKRIPDTPVLEDSSPVSVSRPVSRPIFEGLGLGLGLGLQWLGLGCSDSGTRLETGFETARKIREKIPDIWAEAQSSEEEAVPAKVPRLLAKYQHLRKRHKSAETDSTRTQLAKFLDDEAALSQDAVSFWKGDHAKLRYPALHALAIRVLSVPASSAPVERAFSRGGILMRPHRARLSAKMMETMMFLKCNEHILWSDHWSLLFVSLENGVGNPWQFLSPRSPMRPHKSFWRL